MARSRSDMYLRTFLCAAQRESFRLAANDLCITASAVSHQIKMLEDDLGVKLFIRGAHSLRLSAEGKQYADRLRGVFEQLDEATASIANIPAQSLIRLGLPAFFSAELFVPKLSSFKANHPCIELDIRTIAPDANAANDDVDLAISIGQTSNPNYQSETLFRQRFVAVCSSAFRNSNKLQTLKDLNGKQIITLKDRHSIWDELARSNELRDFKPAKGITFDTMSQVALAAENGVGVAMLALPMADIFMQRHGLVRLFGCEISTDSSYCLIYQKSILQRPEVQSLRQWIKSEFSEAG